MTVPATYAVAPTFLGIERRDRAAAISIAGIPFDIGTSNRSGARFGPAAIRQAIDAVSELMPVYQRALESGIDQVLRGRPVRPANRVRG